MAREWRETDGRAGLPVVDLGHVLRVPRQALEELIGAELADFDSPSRIEEIKETVPPAKPPKPRAGKSTEKKAQLAPTTQRTRRRQNRIANQLDLFDSQPRPS